MQYQDRAYADRYRELVDRVAAAEQRVRPGQPGAASRPSRAITSPLLAYKDEYEVARLHTETDFLASVRRNFGADATRRRSTSPPLFARTDPATGRPKKYELGAGYCPCSACSRSSSSCGAPSSIRSAYGADRRLERALIIRYERVIERIVAELDDRRFELALELARCPQCRARLWSDQDAQPRPARPRREQRLLETWGTPALCAEVPAATASAA